MHPELTRQLGDRPVPSDRRQRHLRLEPRIMFLPCPLHVLLPRYPRVLGAGLHLSQLSHFRGPPHFILPDRTQRLGGILGPPRAEFSIWPEDSTDAGQARPPPSPRTVLSKPPVPPCK